ncbi:MAG TPA: hypothetical protein VFS00_14520, partial [Polyangiaceae bacterium]|nr:hypothetical protein [Polyangiaceae bacterium]
MRPKGACGCHTCRPASSSAIAAGEQTSGRKRIVPATFAPQGAERSLTRATSVSPSHARPLAPTRSSSRVRAT